MPSRHENAGSDTRRTFKKGLSAIEVDRRLVRLSRLHRRVESELCFYLREVDERRLYLKLGFASTLDYARERLGFEQRKAQSLLYMAGRFQELPVLAKAFSAGELPWTKAREVVKVARRETEREWLQKCHEMSNRQLEQEVRRKLPPVKRKVLTFVLEGDRVETWEQTREALERLAGKTLSDLETFDLMCAEVLCTYATTPAFGVEDGEDEVEGGYARKVADRDSWKCTRPGCSNRSGLQANHIVPRSRGGFDNESNLHTVCAVCHAAITAGRLKVTGRAPDALTWEGPLGVIEKALPLESSRQERGASTGRNGRQESAAKIGVAKRGRLGHSVAREGRVSYGLSSYGTRSSPNRDHVIATRNCVGQTRGTHGANAV